jgi:WD40 repeat protein
MDNEEKLAQLWRMVWQVGFSHDGISLASGTGGYIQVWDVTTGREKSFMKGGGRPGSIAFSSNDVSVAWGNWNNEIRLWRVASQSQVVIKTGSAFGNMIFSTDFTRAFVPDGKMTINVVQIPTGRVTNSIRCNEKLY